MSRIRGGRTRGWWVGCGTSRNVARRGRRRVRRGEVWMVDFGIPSGPEQAGIRPAIVLQDDSLTPFISTIIVIPLTTNQKRLAIPTTFLIPAGEPGLNRASFVLFHHVHLRS